jgi:hypothetical protein
MPLLLLVIAGVILRMNADWFHGAGTVGAICLAVAGAIVIVGAVVVGLAGLVAFTTRR